MGKHKGDTDSGGFEGLTPQEKADEFDASHSDPVGYAQENFGASTDPDEINDARRGQGYGHK